MSLYGILFWLFLLLCFIWGVYDRQQELLKQKRIFQSLKRYKKIEARNAARDEWRRMVEENWRVDFWECLTLNQLEKFIAAGADIHAESQYGMQALHWSALNNKNVEVIKKLINTGADVNNKSKHGATALYWAAQRNNNVEVIKYLIKAGADINTKCNDKSTPLHAAARKNENVKIIKELISAGMDVNAKNKKGFTPYDFLSENNSLKDNPEAIALLKP